MNRRIKNLEEVRDLLRNQISLEDVAASYGLLLRPSGQDQLVAICPFHEESQPSLSFSKSKQFFHCFGCKKGGDVYGFIQLHDNLTFTEAVEKLAQIASFDLSVYYADLTAEERQLSHLFAANEWVLTEHARHDVKMEPVYEWFRTRQIDPEQIANFRLGYSEKPPKRPSEFSTAEWHSLGLDRKEQWTDVYVIPVIDAYGRVAGFRNRPVNPGKGPRMLGPIEGHPLEQPPIYGLHQARAHVRKAGQLILVEGEADVWQMHAHGILNVAATLGTKWNADQQKYATAHAIGSILLLPDGDKGGREFALRASRAPSVPHQTLKIATLPDGDPDETLLRDGAAVVQSAIAGGRYAFEYLIEGLLNQHEILTPTAKLDILHELKEPFAARPAYELDLIVAMLSDKLDMNKESLLDFFREAPALETVLYNLRAERIVLQRMVEDELFVGEAVVTLQRNDFYLGKHRTVFDAISLLYRSQDVINADVVRSYLENRGEREAATLVESLSKADADSKSAEFMLADIRDKSVRRETKRKAEELVGRVANTAIDANATIQTFTADIAKIITGGGDKIYSADVLVRDRMAVMHERLRNPNTIIGLDLGPDWRVTNHTLHGVQEHRYIVIAAPTGVGKTLTANAWQRRFSVELNIPTTMFTFETTPEASIDRLVSQMSGVPSDKIITGYLTKEEVEVVQDAAAAIALAPMVITTKGRYIEECIALMRHDYLTRGTQVFFVDYIQLMDIRERGRSMGRTEMLGLVSNALFEFSQEYPVTVVVLAQINRDGAKKGTNITKEDSGEVYRLAQDADVYLILRDKTKDELELDGPEKGDKHWWIDKHRHGRAKIGTNIRSDLETNRIQEA